MDINAELKQALGNKKVEETPEVLTKEKKSYFEIQLDALNSIDKLKDRKEYIKKIDFDHLIEKDSDAATIKSIWVFNDFLNEGVLKETKEETNYIMPERIKKLLEKGKLWDKIVVEELDKKHIGDIATKEAVFLCAIGRLVLNKKSFSFNDLVLAPSSSGKDHLVGSVLKLFPEKDIEIFTRISAKALNYLHTIEEDPDYTYQGKIIYLKEIEEEILNNEVMKEFTSGEEEISKVAITKQKGGGVDVKSIRGHPEIFATTATTIPTEEIRNRYNILGMDLSDEQIKRTFISDEGDYNSEIIEFIADLKPMIVEIPEKIINFIVKNFPHFKQRHKRDFQRFLDFIKVVALFHGRNRAEPEDYNRAKDIFSNAYSTCANIPLKDIDTRVIKILEKTNGEPVSAKGFYDEMGGIITLQNLYPHLRNLVAKEVLNEITERIGGYVTTKFVLSQEFIDKKPFVLPNFFE